MRYLLAGMGVFTAVVAAACGSTSRVSIIDDGTSSGQPGDEAGTGIFDPNAGQDAKPACVGLQCKQVDCGGGPSTSLSGIVWDPAGKNPVYNAVVYVPNTPVDPIKHGAVCDSCGGAPVSGSPVVTTLTDANGAFKLENVPVGEDIPLIIQVGKWRRQVTLPAAPKACQDNPITNPDLTRLPRNKAEGDMPLIALTTGCDPIHTLMEKIGIDKSEFSTGTGTGMVHVYAGQGGTTVVPGATSAYAFWGSATTMLKYDIIINECECTPYARDTMGPAYANIKTYLDAGGRVFNSHYHLNFFGSSSENGGKADPELQSAATWTLWSGTSGASTGPFLIDTSFPKGKAMDDWLTNLATASKWSTPTAPLKKTPKGQIQTTNTGDIGGTKPGISQRWIYPSSGAGAVYVSINTPISKPAADRCGRAVGTGLHVGNGSTTTMSEQEAALEFMFFDLASCVIDDAEPPKPPPPK